MVEHRAAGSWLGATCIALGARMDIIGGPTDWHQFSGAEAPEPSWWCPLKGKEGRSGSLGAGGEPDIPPLTNPWLDTQGRGLRWGESQKPVVLGWSGASAPRHHHLGAGWPFPSGSGKTKRPASGTAGEGPSPPEGRWWSLADSHNPVGAVSFGQAMWDRPPAWNQGQAFLFPLLIYLMILEWFGLFSPDTSPHRKSGLHWPHRFSDYKLNKKSIFSPHGTASRWLNPWGLAIVEHRVAGSWLGVALHCSRRWC